MKIGENLKTAVHFFNSGYVDYLDKNYVSGESKGDSKEETKRLQ